MNINIKRILNLEKSCHKRYIYATPEQLRNIYALHPSKSNGRVREQVLIQ